MTKPQEKMNSITQLQNMYYSIVNQTILKYTYSTQRLKTVVYIKKTTTITTKHAPVIYEPCYRWYRWYRWFNKRQIYCHNNQYSHKSTIHSIKYRGKCISTSTPS